MKATLRWARRHGLLAIVPEIQMPKVPMETKLMRGRPITGEEFEGMLAAVSKMVDNAAAESWRFYLRGLWASGLRLSASLKLRWDDAADALVVDFTGRRLMIRIPAGSHTGNSDALVPTTPQFAALLARVPKCERRGCVFKLLGADGSRVRGGRCLIGKQLSKTGEAAGDLVDEQRKRRKIAHKFASANDLRRAFGVRWSRLVMPLVRHDLMRHESIQTTMKYYVGTNAEATVDTKGNISGNIRRRSKRAASKSAFNPSTGERT